MEPKFRPCTVSFASQGSKSYFHNNCSLWFNYCLVIETRCALRLYDQTLSHRWLMRMLLQNLRVHEWNVQPLFYFPEHPNRTEPSQQFLSSCSPQIIMPRCPSTWCSPESSKHLESPAIHQAALNLPTPLTYPNMQFKIAMETAIWRAKWTSDPLLTAKILLQEVHSKTI